MKQRHFTFDGRMIVTDLELFDKARSRYRAKFGDCADLPSSSLTEFEEIDAFSMQGLLYTTTELIETQSIIQRLVYSQQR